MSCSICLEPYGTHTITLACRHIFHASCLLKHIKTSARGTLDGERACPLCRAVLARHVPTHQETVAPKLETPLLLRSYGFIVRADDTVTLILRRQDIF